MVESRVEATAWKHHKQKLVLVWSANRLLDRFPRTQKAINAALTVADASILMDNSRGLDQAFTVCRVQVGENEVFDARAGDAPVPVKISPWLEIVSPRPVR